MKKTVVRKRIVEVNPRKYYKGPMFAAPGEVGPLFGYCSFDDVKEIDSEFAIIDLETSGLSATNSRVLEIAILRVNKKGKIIDSFETLINPESEDVGRSDIHQITLRMLKKAPNFSEVSGNILNLLSGAVVVAHNAKFEENFLQSEFSRLGKTLTQIPAIDTMWIAQMKLDLYNYKLNTVADYFGVTVENAHTAMGDISAMREFFPKLLAMSPEIRFPIELSKFSKLDNSDSLVTRSGS
jgi:DNA polymerase III epsilon subunit family exonuclease